MTNKINRRKALKQISTLGAVILGAPLLKPKFALAEDNWQNILKKAKNQEVYFNAWAGDQKINSYISWAGKKVYSDYGVKLIHIKISNTSEVVQKVLAEKIAQEKNGSVDLIWINGLNFYNMKKGGLLHGPFANNLPNYQLTDPDNQPTITSDFTIPTDGYESPWGQAHFVLIYNADRVKNPPSNILNTLDWARKNPNRFCYPLPPDFTGISFLKQALLEIALQNNIPLETFTKPAVEGVTEKLWNWLDQLHPYCWRKGKAFPANYSMLRNMLNNSVVDFAMSYNPNEAANSVINNLLPASSKAYASDKGSLSNTHFLAIPFNSAHKEGAQVVANFFLSFEAQKRKEDIKIWGDPTVLSTNKLSPQQQKEFSELQRHPSQAPLSNFAKTLSEPHPTWSQKIEQEWLERYGLG